MLIRKRTREKGKFSFTKYFQEFQPGEAVSVVRELSLPLDYLKQIQGRTGKVVAKRGSAYEVAIFDYNKEKRYMIKPIHLRRIKNENASS